MQYIRYRTINDKVTELVGACLGPSRWYQFTLAKERIAATIVSRETEVTYFDYSRDNLHPRHDDLGRALGHRPHTAP